MLLSDVLLRCLLSAALVMWCCGAANQHPHPAAHLLLRCPHCVLTGGSPCPPCQPPAWDGPLTCALCPPPLQVRMNHVEDIEEELKSRARAARDAQQEAYGSDSDDDGMGGRRVQCAQQ